MQGRIHRINVSDGGVPKRAVSQAAVTYTGLAGDSQGHPDIHGGPTRAVSLLGLDVIERLRAAGHPIAPGSAGENLTLEGVAWAALGIGDRLRFEGGVEIELLSHAHPCGTIRGSFLEGDTSLLDAKKSPGCARFYAGVRAEGALRQGEGFVVASYGAA